MTVHKTLGCLAGGAALLVLLALPALAQAPGLPASASELRLFSEEFPPYNFLAGDGVTVRGSSIELAQAICKRLGLQTVGAGIQIMPWARAYRLVQTTPNSALFAMTRTPEREKLFKWVGPISLARNVLLARKANHIKLQSLAEASRYRIGVIKDDAGEQLLLRAGIPAAQLDSAESAHSNLLKLAKGRIELFAYDENVCSWQLRLMGLAPEDYESVWVVHEGQHYFAFNPQTDDALVKAFQRELDALKRSGEYQAIMDKYLK